MTINYLSLTGTNSTIRTQPNIIPNNDGLRKLLPRRSPLRLQRMSGSRYTNVRPHQAIITDGYRIAIQNDDSVIAVQSPTDAEMRTVIHLKWRFYPGVSFRVRKELFQYRVAFGFVVGTRRVVFETQTFGPTSFLQELRIEGVVQFAGQHLLFLCHVCCCVCCCCYCRFGFFGGAITASFRRRRQ